MDVVIDVEQNRSTGLTICEVTDRGHTVEYNRSGNCVSV